MDMRVGEIIVVLLVVFILIAMVLSFLEFYHSFCRKICELISLKDCRFCGYPPSTTLKDPKFLMISLLTITIVMFVILYFLKQREGGLYADE
jgi:hypothetical protein